MRATSSRRWAGGWAVQEGDFVRYVGRGMNRHGFLFIVGEPMGADQQWSLFKSVATGERVMMKNTDLEPMPDEGG